MKKTALALLTMILVSGIALAGYNVKLKASFSGTGTSAAAVGVTIPANDGYAISDTMYISCETNANLTIYRPRYKSTAFAAASAATSIVVHTDSSNTLDGFSLTTSDYILVRHTGTSGYQLAKTTQVGAWSAGTTNATTYGLDTSVTCSAEDPVYLIDVDDNLTFPCLASSDQTDLHSIFTGFRDMPLYLTIPVTAGVTVLGGTYDVVK